MLHGHDDPADDEGDSDTVYNSVYALSHLTFNYSPSTDYQAIHWSSQTPPQTSFGNMRSYTELLITLLDIICTGGAMSRDPEMASRPFARPWFSTLDKSLNVIETRRVLPGEVTCSMICYMWDRRLY
jgi:hypothetical protein